MLSGWLLLVLAACRPSPEAPGEMNDLSRYLYRHWDSADEDVREAGVAALYEVIRDVDPEESVIDRSWAMDPLEDGDVVGMEHPNRDLSALVGVGVASRSPWPITEHARVQTLDDQAPFEPSAVDYLRVFPDADEPDCFADASCEVLVSFNEARRQNVLFRVNFELHKVFRWVDVTLRDGEPRRAFYSRSWFSQPWPGDRDNVTLWQSFSLDVWIEDDRGGTLRYQVPWNEFDLGISVTDTAAIATVRGGTDDIFRTTDRMIAELWHDGELPEVK